MFLKANILKNHNGRKISTASDELGFNTLGSQLGLSIMRTQIKVTTPEIEQYRSLLKKLNSKEKLSMKLMVKAISHNVKPSAKKKSQSTK